MTGRPARAGGRTGRGIAVQNASKRSLERFSAVLAPDGTTDAPVAEPAGAWRLWFAARLGPPRKRTKTVNGVKVEYRARSLELPPSPNDRLHHQAKAKIVKDWRDAARDHAKTMLGHVVPMQRARVSIVVYRDRLGIADPDNDLARCKPIIDGLRDAGVLSRDTYGAVSFGFIGEKRSDRRGPGIDVLLTEEEA